jgi:hypothetical protein
VAVKLLNKISSRNDVLKHGGWNRNQLCPCFRSTSETHEAFAYSESQPMRRTGQLFFLFEKVKMFYRVINLNLDRNTKHRTFLQYSQHKHQSSVWPHLKMIRRHTECDVASWGQVSAGSPCIQELYNAVEARPTWCRSQCIVPLLPQWHQSSWHLGARDQQRHTAVSCEINPFRSDRDNFSEYSPRKYTAILFWVFLCSLSLLFQNHLQR